MTLLEEKKVLDQLDDDNLIENKYQRVGHIDEGRICDSLVAYCKEKLTGQALPARWKYGTQEKFKATYGTGSYWSLTKSYHNYIHNGQYIFRIWTNAGKKYALVDLPTAVAVVVGLSLDVEDIPVGSKLKCRPMTHRLKVSHTSDIDIILDAVKSIYGV